ncbi:MAG TPA: TRAM domain-containing protein [Thermoanaerobaculia bacterium]|nr:TRAM domain-containing protein [Thermoanaerobaculia bacterium]
MSKRDKRDAPVRVGQVVEVRPHTLVAGGESLSKIDGFPIFVPSLYPGDVAKVQITEVKRGFARGATSTILERSPARRLEPCPVAETCGGCDWTALRLDHQLRAKEAILRSSLERVGKFPASDLPPITLHPSPLRYRLRSRLQISAQGEVGFFAERSHTVVPLPEECEVVGPALIRNLRRVTALAKRGTASQIECFENEQSFDLSSDDDAEGVAVSIEVGAFRFALSTKAFFQVNRHLLSKLVELVGSSARATRAKNVAFDLYAGVGFFSLPLSQIFDVVYSVEGAAVSHRFAKRNAAPYQNIRLFGEKVETFLERGLTSVDLIVVDPPRAGLDPEVIEAIDGTRATRICYLSCDPVTFARDASLLTRRGWSLTALDLLDLFPNTHHVETLSSFERVE